MNAFSKINKRRFMLFAALVSTIALACASASAANNKGVLRTDANGTYTGPCCSSWNESVSVYEPSSLLPIVATWSTDYQSNAPFIAGLSLNGGPCSFFGSSSVTAQSPYDGRYTASATYQWLILPGDFGLRKGRNVLTLCGGGVLDDTDAITIWANTLAAHLQR